MRILIFGTGNYYQKYKKFFSNHEIVGFLDNDSIQQGTFLDDVKISAPNEITNFKYDQIFIMSSSEQPIRNQLLQLGVKRDKICTVHNLFSLQHSLDNPCYYFSNLTRENPHKCALLISHALSYSGAPLALISLGRILLLKGYQVTIASPIDQCVFRQDLLREGMSVIIDEALNYGRLQDLPWVKKFNFIGVNTVCLYNLLLGWNGKPPIFWWIHEVRESYDTFNSARLMPVRKSRGLFIYAVSARAKKFFMEQCKGIHVRELIYGLTDEAQPEIRKKAKIVFAIIGAVVYRKGMDLLLKVIRKILDHGYNDCQFWVIGDYNSTVYGEEMHRCSSSIPQIHFLGELTHKELMKVFPDITAVVVPSRDETMSIAANEAMMHSVGCIVSEDTGVAPYVEKEHAGIVCPTEDTDCWVTAMEWVIKNPKQWEEFGVRGRATYEKYFSMKVFEKNVDKMLREIRQ